MISIKFSSSVKEVFDSETVSIAHCESRSEIGIEIGAEFGTKSDSEICDWIKENEVWSFG